MLTVGDYSMLDGSERSETEVRDISPTRTLTLYAACSVLVQWRIQRQPLDLTTQEHLPSVTTMTNWSANGSASALQQVLVVKGPNESGGGDEETDGEGETWKHAWGGDDPDEDFMEEYKDEGLAGVGTGLKVAGVPQASNNEKDRSGTHRA